MDFSPEKDQHILKNSEIIEKEVLIANIKEEDIVLEIGAGTGDLTKKISEKCSVVAFEIDEKFRESLKKIEGKNVKIIFADALKSSWKGINKIVSNIPYSKSEPIFQKMIKSEINSGVLIVGKHFKNILEERQTKFGILWSLFFNTESIERISKEEFEPPPRYDSWMIKISRKKQSKIERVLGNMILGKGKTKNSLRNSLMLEGLTKKQSKAKINEINIPENILNKSVSRITGKAISIIEENLKKSDL